MRPFMLALGFVTTILAAGACEQSPPTPPLIAAVRAGSLAEIGRLLAGGADLDGAWPTDDTWPATPLQHAILARQAGAVQLLLDRGADPNRSAAPRSVAPLFLAAGDADPIFVKLLLAHGADPAAVDEHGDTPLSRAVAAGTFHGPDRPMFGGCRVETVRALLQHNPALRLQGEAGKRAIWWARVQDCEGVLRLIGGAGG